MIPPAVPMVALPRVIIDDEHGNRVALDDHGHKVYKTLMIVGQSYACDKDCPYCTAKITQWPTGSDQWQRLGDCLGRIEQAGVRFEYLTISGNGEPSLQPLPVLKDIRAVFDQYDHLFTYKRMQTSGNIFFHPERWEMFKDYVFEITRVSLDDDEDHSVLRAPKKYTQSDLFWKSSVVLNHSLLRKNIGTLINDINGYLARFPNLHVLNLKILNVNTLDSQLVNNSGSQWILDNAILKEEADDIADILKKHFPETDSYHEFYDRIVFEGKTPHGRTVPITFYTRDKNYGLANIVFYKGELVDYQLQPKKF